jgi:hypothetical protein
MFSEEMEAAFPPWGSHTRMGKGTLECVPLPHLPGPGASTSGIASAPRDGSSGRSN